MYAARKIFTKTSSLVLCLGGLLFATHPVHCDSISSIVSRGEAFSGLFSLLSFLTYASAFKAQDRIHVSYARIVVSIVLAGVGTFCKEQCITVIAVNMAYDFSVVCEQDAISFLTTLYESVFGRADKLKSDSDDLSVQASHANGSAEPAPLPKSHFPPWLKALLLRLLIATIGIAIILYIRLSQNAFRERFDPYSSRLPLVFAPSLSSFLLAAAIFIKKFSSRALTKAFYAAKHAWLTLVPWGLCVEWAGRGFAHHSTSAKMMILHI